MESGGSERKGGGDGKKKMRVGERDRHGRKKMRVGERDRHGRKTIGVGEPDRDGMKKTRVEQSMLGMGGRR